jgi:hypothetical protein
VCRKCHSDGPFYPSWELRSNYLCKKCASAAVKESRTRDPARMLAYRATQNLGCHVPSSMVERVLQRCQYRSIISGESDPNILCLVPYFRELPLEDWHCLIMTRYEARAFARAHSPAMIPESILRQLYSQRQLRCCS